MKTTTDIEAIACLVEDAIACLNPDNPQNVTAIGYLSLALRKLQRMEIEKDKTDVNFLEKEKIRNPGTLDKHSGVANERNKG